MIHIARSLGLAIVLGALSPVASMAGPQPESKLLLHLVPFERGTKQNCTTIKAAEAADVRTHGELGREYLAYVIVTDFVAEEGITGVQFGITFDNEPESGVDILSWQDCALYQWHMDDWPEANTGNMLTWHQEQGCQRESPVVVGFFHLKAYSDDVIKIIPRPVDGLARVASCALRTKNVNEYIDDIRAENLGAIGFGKTEGYNPWDPAENMATPKQFEPVKSNR